MRYEGVVYRPPSEAGSLLIQATIGCPHNKCTFCGMYKEKRFKIRKVEDIKKDLATALTVYGSGVRTLFLPDGNTILMKTEQLLEILDYAHQLFPNLERVTVYGSAKFIVRKKPQELRRLREAGLKRIHTGMESGDDPTLERIKKGVTAHEIIRAGRMVKEAGIEQSEYFLVGIAGIERSEEHARNSGRVLSEIDPEFIRLRTYVPQPGTPLYEDYIQGKFTLLTPHQALHEVAVLLENLEGTGMVLSDHVSNYANVSGRLPEDKKDMLEALRYALSLPESRFRSSLLHCL
jgi:radical SAM superfamily enzyme YgiQ (UPF0313 family)